MPLTRHPRPTWGSPLFIDRWTESCTRGTLPSMSRPLLCAAVVACVAAAVPLAWAAGTLRGETAQRRAVVLTVADDGRVERVRVGWKARCRRDRASFEDTTDVLPPFERSTSDGFRASGTYTTRDRGRIRSTITLTVDGTRSGKRWSGTVEATVRVRRRGRAHDRCTLAPTRWSAGG